MQIIYWHSWRAKKACVDIMRLSKGLWQIPQKMLSKTGHGVVKRLFYFVESLETGTKNANKWTFLWIEISK